MGGAGSEGAAWRGSGKGILFPMSHTWGTSMNRRMLTLAGGAGCVADCAMGRGQPHADTAPEEGSWVRMRNRDAQLSLRGNRAECAAVGCFRRVRRKPIPGSVTVAPQILAQH